ncbi:MAG: DJ-1 family glyoxalase III [Candidatus Aenigmatarchaeota archaeon]
MRLVMPLADGFEEIEAFVPLSVLRGAGVQVDIVGLAGSIATGGHNTRVATDRRLADVRPDDYDGIIIPGGSRGCANLERSKAAMDLISDMDEKGKLVAAICAAPALLAKAGVLRNRKATVYPGMERELPYPRPGSVVVDGNVITSQGPGTAMEFALEILKHVLGPEAAKKHRKGLVA